MAWCLLWHPAAAVVIKNPQPTFDCQTAQLESEKFICADDDLAKLNEESKLLSIPGYDEQCYRCMQTHFVEAVPAFLNYKNDSKARFYPSLFETWNLYAELGIVENNGMPTGAISRKNIVGTELNDVMYVSGTYDLGIAIYVYGVSGNNEIHCGPTETRVEGGNKSDEIYSYQGNKVIVEEVKYA